MDAFESRLEQAKGLAAIDFGLHMTIASSEAKKMGQIPEAMEAGVVTFKHYTTYEFQLDDERLLKAFHAVWQAGGLPIVHCENDAIIQWHTAQYLEAGETSPGCHPRSRPAAAEGEAIERVLSLARSVEAPFHIVHVCSARGVAALARAREQVCFGETYPQYLLLTDQACESAGFEGAKYMCSPPLRTGRDKRSLWQTLRGGELQVIATDHCPFYYQGQKDLGRERSTDILGGIPSIESRLALIHTFGVGEGLLDLNGRAELCCTALPKLFGLYPQKGILAPGADADIVIFGPQKQVRLSRRLLHENVDYSPYEGLEPTGYPVTTLSHGIPLEQAPYGFWEFLEQSGGQW